MNNVPSYNSRAPALLAAPPRSLVLRRGCRSLGDPAEWARLRTAYREGGRG